MRLDLAGFQRFHRLGDGEIGLAGAGRAQRQHHALAVDRIHELLLRRAHRPDVFHIFSVSKFVIGVVRGPGLLAAGEKRMHIFLKGRVTRLRTHGALGHGYSRCGAV